MEVGSTLLLRLFLLLVALLGAEKSTRRWVGTSTVKPFSLHAVSLLSTALVLAALACVPSVDIEANGATSVSSSLFGIWALLWAALCLESPFEDWEQGHWLCAWGLSIAAPVTLFSSLQLTHIEAAQDKLWLDLLPSWGMFLQPLAFLTAVFAIAGWVGDRAPTLSLQNRRGLITGLLLATTVATFLGGWHIPWVSDRVFAEGLGQRLMILACIQWLVFVFKTTLLWLLVVWIHRFRSKLLFPHAGFCLNVASALCLILTWVVLAWKVA